MVCLSVRPLLLLHTLGAWFPNVMWLWLRSVFSVQSDSSLLQKVMASRWETLLTLVADSCVLEFSLNTIISGLPSSLDASSSSSTSSHFSLQLNFPCMFSCSTLQTTDTSINDPRWLGGSQCAIRTSVQSTAFLWLWLELFSLISIFDLSIILNFHLLSLFYYFFYIFQIPDFIHKLQTITIKNEKEPGQISVQGEEERLKCCRNSYWNISTSAESQSTLFYFSCIFQDWHFATKIKSVYLH